MMGTTRKDVLAMLGGACAMGLNCAESIADGADVTIVTTPNETAAEPFFAQDMGFFKSAGLDVEVTSSPNGAAIAAAVASGAVQIGNSSVSSLAQAHVKHIPFVIIAPGGLYSSRAPSAILFLPRQSPIKSGKDLDGKTIGINNLRGVPQYGTQAWIDAHGGNSESVKFIEMSAPDIIAALQQNRIDAGLIPEPYVTAARAAVVPLAAVFDAVSPSFMINVHFATLDWAKSHIDIVRRFRDCIKKTSSWANKNSDQSGRILMRYSKLSPETLRTMQRTIFAEDVNAADIQPLIDLTAKYGGIPAFPADEFIYRPA
jgi:NitT/TauT family transport system substrate-binding protein